MSYTTKDINKKHRIHRYLIDMRIYTTNMIQCDLLLKKNIDLIDFRNFERNYLFEPDAYTNKYSIYQINNFFNIIENNDLKHKLSKINKTLSKIINLNGKYNEFEYNQYNQEIELKKLQIFPKEIDTLIMCFL
jgi:hypothetical protein